MALTRLLIYFPKTNLLAALDRSFCENKLTRVQMPCLSTSHEEIYILYLIFQHSQGGRG